MNEYIVTCRSYEDLEDLYDDMETPGGSLYIPDRAVDLVHRRAISRNTHYMLTEEEAVEIRNDERVIACERLAKDRGIVPDYLWVQTGDFEKTTGTLQSDDKNWGLYRIDRGDYYDQTPTTYTLTVTGASSPNHYIISGSDRLYSYNNNNDPTLTIYAYDTITFNNQVSAGHPLEIRSSLGGSQVSNPAASGQGTATVTWTPTTAGTYYYQCTVHPNMNGQIIVNARTKTWGSDSSTTELSNKTIVTTASGKNVDVVIVDAHINPDHPEFAVNVDGTGGSRVNQFNWFQYSSALGYSTAATYTYSTSGAGTFSQPNSNHGTHVAGTACGNTQGWARDANIYNMAFSDALSGVTDWDEKLWDYLRYFHLNKPINPDTGRRNPTVTNHSWGYNQGTIYMTSVNSVYYRGTSVTITGTLAQIQALLEANGHPPGYEDQNGTKYFNRIPVRVAAVDADLQDAINDGVIVISAAGNSYFNSDLPTGLDWNNTMSTSSNTYYASRGSTPSAADQVIAVGSIGSLEDEYKSDFSQWGLNVDIWAPGSDIISAVYDLGSAQNEGYGSYPNTTPTDPRNSNYYLCSISGTSMASPQVCGVIACLAEQEPYMTQEDARTHLIENSVSNIGSTGSDNTEPYHALGSTSYNRYLTMPKKRPDSGMLSPAMRHKNRNSDTDGVKFPRVRNNRVFK